ncbi:subunit 17 of mediator complex-domain-containing protein [Daldinia decipiens]|uniref:subunit 17 of mediator complex-domain-containing protein n=1 Tax=Daldinia decipiens TaxID=326647 RepID=UPI0020C3FF6E|nr:subunit 17 of mediator complex-domain-containing protein [Daldinia decipiens]KAI1662891.1 subunit 17 of mediator complex-domain-containing protein [Daldinia decipiens]
MASSSSPFSLRPWPIGDKKPKNLGEFISRINVQSGGFRNVTEAKLREEIAAQQHGRVEAEGSSDEEEDEDVELKSVTAAREEFLKNIEVAHQSAMLSLDFVSLLLTKQDPRALSTLSPELRELVGIGTLGASKLNESNIIEARMQDDLAVATGWRLMGVNNMVDSVVAAAEKLEKEMQLETKYWADVLTVSEGGWAVCAAPQEPHTLGVRFGFAESAPEFRNSSIAPFRRNDDGTVRLGLGRIGGGSQRVRLTLKKNGIIVDQSPLPGRIPDDAPLQDRVREARNTAFHQELWYEINREARTLLSSDVYSDSSSITWKQDPETDLIFTLEDLGEPDNANERMANMQCSCTAYYIYIQFLLFQGHRQNYHRRTTMAQLPSNRMQSPYAILRAVIANTEYFRDCKAMTDFLDDLVFTLKRAGISTAACKSATQPLTPILLQGSLTRRNAKTELNFINYLAGRLESAFELAITPEVRIFGRARIMVVPYIQMHFNISLTPFPPQNGTLESNKGATSTNQKTKNPLEDLYPPADLNREAYPNAKDAIYYIQQATVRALTQIIAVDAGKKLRRDDIYWTETVHGPGVVDRDDSEARVNIKEDSDGRLILTLDGQWKEGNHTARHVWTWRGDRGDEGGNSITDAVVRVMQSYSQQGDGVAD